MNGNRQLDDTGEYHRHKKLRPGIKGGKIPETLAEQDIGIEVKNHPDPLFAGAIGAAIWGAFRHDQAVDTWPAGGGS